MAKSGGLRRKDVSGFPGEHEVVGLSTGWGWACSLQPGTT